MSDTNNVAQNIPGQSLTIPIPDTTLPAIVMERMLNYLGNPSVWVRNPDGSMRGFVDPLPMIAIVREHMFAELQRQGVLPSQPTAN
jgi:hypothetical protein